MVRNRAAFSRRRVSILFFVRDIVNRGPVDRAAVISFQVTKGRAGIIRMMNRPVNAASELSEQVNPCLKCPKELRT